MVRGSVDVGHSTCFAIVKPGLGKTAMCVTGMHTAAKTPRLTALLSPNCARNLNTKMRYMRKVLTFIVGHDVIKNVWPEDIKKKKRYYN